MVTSPQRTPLCQEHETYPAKMVEFANWWMPIEYVGLKTEHVNCRTNVGIFDVSHMGEFRVKGPNALKTIEWFTTNHVEKLESGEAQYSLFPNPQGGVVDDLIVYCLEKNNDYLLCVNAANEPKDWAWINQNNQGATLINESSQWAQIAIQGPKALKLCDEIFGLPVSEVKFFNLIKNQYRGHECIIARTGYTGEEGCEVFIRPQGAPQLWRDLLEKGKKVQLLPVGLGARDTLRLEAKLPLYGHELSDQTNPYAAGLGYFVKPKNKDFIGKDIILKNKENLTQKLIGFKMIDKGIPRHGYSLFSFDNKEIGKVTSGTHSPSLDEPIGLAYIDSGYTTLGTEFQVQIRNRMIKAKVVETPFVKKY